MLVCKVFLQSEAGLCPFNDYIDTLFCIYHYFNFFAIEQDEAM